MTIEYKDSKRIQGIAGVDVAGSFTSSTNPSSAALALGGGSGSGNTKVGFEVQTGHFLVNKGLKTLTFALDKYGTVSGNGYVAVYNSSGTQKGSNSSTYDLGTLTQYSDPVDYTFTWATPITIANGDRIVLEGGTFNTSNQVDLYSDNSSASEAYVNGVYFNSGWTSLSGTDVHFDVTTATNNGDTKPTNVQDNSILVEKDTARRYWFDADAETETESTGTYSSDVTTCSGDNDRNGFMVNSTSSAVYGKTINSVSFYLKKTGSPTGTAYVRVWSGSNSGSGTQVHEFGTIDVSTLTTSYVKYTFNTGSHTLAVNDTVGLQYSGSTSNAPVMQGATSDVYDGTNTIRNRFTSGAFSPVTSHDMRFAITEATPTWTYQAKAKTPAQIGNLKVHYDATVGVTASSNSVSAWADQSGNGKTLSSVSNPTRVVAGLNGKDYLDFNSSKSMRATGLSETAPRPFTMVAVINPRSGGSQTIIRWSQSNYLALYQNPANTYYMSGGTELPLTDSTLDGSWNAFFMDFKSNADGGTLQINLDTANAVSGTLGSNGTSGTTATLHVGINADNNNWQGSCRYAEIIIFDNVLTAFEKEDLYKHLKTKWGLP